MTPRASSPVTPALPNGERIEDIAAALVKEGLGMIIESVGMGACGKFAVAVIGALG